jgi:HAE1 family hydrophobic/amphiphilic exporter-1
MGVAIIGGLISSTLLTLLVVPAAYTYIDRFRVWSTNAFRRWVGSAPVDTSET